MKSKQMENAINEARDKYRNKRGRYDMRCEEWLELGGIANTKLLEAISMSFDYGFVKGIRFAKSQMKRRGGVL